jgi:ribosomal protein L19
MFNTGDVVSLSFRNKGLNYFFEGICISIKYKSFLSPECSFILRNILSGVGVELNLSFFYNRLFSLKLNSYKKKRSSYFKSKLFFIRYKLNRTSRVL